MMEIERLLNPQTISVAMGGVSKSEAFQQLVSLMEQAGLIQNKAPVVTKLEERESLGPTGLGHGVAVPHARCEGMNGLAMAIGIAPSGLAFDSGDGEPVSILVVIVAPQGDMGSHVLAVAQVSRILHNDDTRKRLKRARNADEVIDILSEASHNLGGRR